MASISTLRVVGRSSTTTTGRWSSVPEYNDMMVLINITCSHFGHDKSLEIKPYAQLPHDERPTLLYAGDGVSDLSAASETDLLFAKKGNGSLILFIHNFETVG